MSLALDLRGEFRQSRRGHRDERHRFRTRPVYVSLFACAILAAIDRPCESPCGQERVVASADYDDNDDAGHEGGGGGQQKPTGWGRFAGEERPAKERKKMHGWMDRWMD